MQVSIILYTRLLKKKGDDKRIKKEKKNKKENTKAGVHIFTLLVWQM